MTQHLGVTKVRKQILSISTTVFTVITSMLISFPDRTYADQINNPSTESFISGYLDLSLTPDILNPQTNRKKPDFSGTWIFDPEASDDPETVLIDTHDKKKSTINNGSRDHAGKRPGGGPNGKMPGNRGPAGKRPEGRGKGDNRHAGLHQSMQSLIQELKLPVMVIYHKEPVFEIITKDTRVIYTDYRYSSVISIDGSSLITATAGWEDNTLVIHFDTTVHKNVIQRFALLSEPYRLQRITELSPEQPGDKVLSIKQIFQLKGRN